MSIPNRLYVNDSLTDKKAVWRSAAGALAQAQNNLSLKIELGIARKILVLVSAPKDTITLGLLEEISNFLQDESPKSVIRIGDYPRRGKEISVTLIASKLTEMGRIEDLYVSAQDLFNKQEEIDREAAQKIDRLHRSAQNLPSLEQLHSISMAG